ncbi:MAG: hypothetical protein IK077_04230, partial [Thermoguttaceae bacterium]|nr:hypothetical protein [Thermoguttaceae bacterium]
GRDARNRAVKTIGDVGMAYDDQNFLTGHWKPRWKGKRYDNLRISTRVARKSYCKSSDRFIKTRFFGA